MSQLVQSESRQWFILKQMFQSELTLIITDKRVKLKHDETKWFIPVSETWNSGLMRHLTCRNNRSHLNCSGTAKFRFPSYGLSSHHCILILVDSPCKVPLVYNFSLFCSDSGLKYKKILLRPWTLTLKVTSEVIGIGLIGIATLIYPLVYTL